MRCFLPSPLAGEGSERSERVRGKAETRGVPHPSPGGEAPPPSPARGEGKTNSLPLGRGAGGVGLILATPFRVVDLAGDSPVDLWHLKQKYPHWLPWIDADYGSAAYLPLIDGANYRATLSPLGGLVARPADAATAEKLKAAGW